MRRWTAIALILALGAPVGGCLTPRTSLAWNLPGVGWSERETAFNARLQARFPPGTREEDLVRGLSRQGFRPAPPWTPDERHMAIQWSEVVCGVAARVFWQTDDQRRLTHIRGVYREEGCL